MRLMRSQLTDELAVIGPRAAVRIGPGATVDVDQVVGEATTVGDALGSALLAGFVPVEGAEREAPARRDRGRPAAPAGEQE